MTISRSAFCSFRMKLGLASTKWGSWYPRAMASTAIRSPPTSFAMEARSSVVVITFNLP